MTPRAAVPTRPSASAHAPAFATHPRFVHIVIEFAPPRLPHLRNAVHADAEAYQCKEPLTQGHPHDGASIVVRTLRPTAEAEEELQRLPPDHAVHGSLDHRQRAVDPAAHVRAFVPGIEQALDDLPSRIREDADRDRAKQDQPKGSRHDHTERPARVGDPSANSPNATRNARVPIRR